MPGISEIWPHTNSGTTHHISGNTRYQIVPRANFTAAQIIANLIAAGAVDRRPGSLNPINTTVAIIAMEGMSVLPQVTASEGGTGAAPQSVKDQVVERLVDAHVLAADQAGDAAAVLADLFDDEPVDHGDRDELSERRRLS
jgi:hypothetical protein